MVKTTLQHGFGKKGTRRNTHTDRMNTTGTASGKFQHKRLLNWGGRPEDETVDDFSALSPADPAYDSCDELFEKAFGKPRGSHVNFNWAAADDVSDSDNEQMDEIEAKMQSDWMREVERELKEVQDDAEEWFNGQ
mmetsp:Transcript_8361/g.21661  ORF Transcript_8361/g.21661 Transcript_8361/m.21661 type:complete len:135 (-) Transcript_8361:208-612(-)